MTTLKLTVGGNNTSITFANKTRKPEKWTSRSRNMLPLMFLVVIDAKSVARLSGVRAVEVIDGVEHYTYRMLDEDLRMLDWDAGTIAANDPAILHRGKSLESLGLATLGDEEAAGRKPAPPCRVAPHHGAGDERPCLPQATARQAGEAGRSILNRLSTNNAALQKLQSRNYCQN